jgi:Tfp pilus assembly major pilin PilA
MEAASTQDVAALYRAAVGVKKADFYVPKFVRFDQAGSSRLSWNWSAFFVSFYWFLYRRMYGTWAIYSLFIPIVIGVLTTVLGRTLGTAAGDWFYSVVSIGYSFGVIPALANSFYHREVRDRIAVLRHKVPETSGQLLELENTSPTNNIISIIVVIIMIAMLGILAAIAIPAYQDYTIRAQVREGFLVANQMKSAVVENYESSKSWPEGHVDISQLISGQYIEALAIDRGTISVTYGNRANPLIASRVLSLRPALNDSGAIVWACGYAKVAGKEEPDDPIGPDLTNIEPKFLPRECR